MTMPRVTCPHCGAVLALNAIAKHVRTCVHNPVALEAIGRTIPDPDRPGYAISIREYEKAARKTGAPSYNKLLIDLGHWREVCAMFGLLPNRGEEQPSRDKLHTCPHCGRERGSKGHAAHMRVCPKDPALYDAIRQALTDPNTGAGRTRDEYRLARTACLPPDRVLVSVFSAWGDVLAYYALGLPLDGEARLLAAIAAEAEETRRLLRQEWEGSYGLPVCGVREIDGGRRVAWVLR